jgi:hypothetical protein
MAEFLHHAGEALSIVLYNYANGATAVQLVDGDGLPYATLSANIPGLSEHLPEGTFYLKDYSENERIAKAAIDSGLIVRDLRADPVRSGFAIFHPYRLAVTLL